MLEHHRCKHWRTHALRVLCDSFKVNHAYLFAQEKSLKREPLTFKFIESFNGKEWDWRMTIFMQAVSRWLNHRDETNERKQTNFRDEFDVHRGTRKK